MVVSNASEVQQEKFMYSIYKFYNFWRKLNGAFCKQPKYAFNAAFWKCRRDSPELSMTKN